MRDALSTLDQVIAFCGASVPDEDVLALLGMVDRRLLLDTAEGIVARDSRMALDALRRVDHLGHSFRQFCLELVEIFRALVLLKVATEPGELLDVTGEELLELKQLAERASLEEHQRALTLLMKTEGELAMSSFPRLALEMTLVRLTHLPPARDVATLVAKLEDLERRLASGGGVALAAPSRPAVSAPRSPAPSVPPPPPESPPGKKAEAPVPSAASEQGWPGLVEHVRGRRRPAIAAVLEQASLLAYALPQLQLGLPRGSFAIAQLQDRENLESLHQLASEYFGQPVQIVITAIDASQAAVPPSLVETKRAEESDRARRLREDALAHPMVKAVCDIFGAEVKEVKPIDKGFV
jgi:DNA polymerase-3 subunit gamma/tau